MVSIFAEQISILPELKIYHKTISKAQDIYIPGYPPISPITHSYFTLWIFNDFFIGKNKETITSILIDLADIFEISVGWIDLIKIRMKSRMSIYQHCGFSNKHILLKEFVTEKKHKCICPAGYTGHKGELWMVRILESLFDLLDYSVVFTTPYVLMGHTSEEWSNFFIRNNIQDNDPDVGSKIQRFMKQGNRNDLKKSRFYWHEYITEGYHGYKKDAIFLFGIPDLPKTLPHSGMFGEDEI